MSRVSAPPRATSAPLRDPDDVAWEAIEASPEYRDLSASQRRFIAPATIGYLLAYFGFLIVAGLAPGFMGTKLYRGFTLGYLLMIGLFVLVWVLVWAYLRTASRDWDPRAEAIAERVEAGDYRAARTPAAGGDER